VLFGYAKKAGCAPTCVKPIKPLNVCCSGGGQVTWIVSANTAHTSGWMELHDIAAPANGTYDITFWYHCGGGDTYGDDNCGGDAMTQPGQKGCRPTVFTINGTLMPGAYHFPCFSGSGGIIHAATVSLPLSQGMNTIKYAPPVPRDAADLDAIEVLSSGKGVAPRVAVNTKDLIGA
jgi:hypothetical protein